MATQHEIVGDEWKSRAPELAQWAMDHLVNRKDVWGQYSILSPSEQRESGRSYKAMTLPVKSKRGKDMVTLDKLTRHFASRRTFKPQLIGLHEKSKESTSRWLGIDIDCHDTESAQAEDHARRNLAGALAWWREFQSRGYDPLLFDSSNKGGYHLWVILAEPAPTMDVFALGQSVIANWRELNLEEEPETFPKLPKEGSLGSWFRLPGLHHTREHYGRVWSGDEWLSDPWLSGHAAIDTMLQTMPGPPPPSAKPISEHSRVTRFSRDERDATGSANSKRQAVSSKPAVATPAASASSRKQRFERSGKATVCVDLDGVLARRGGGHAGHLVIGDPVDGAREFLQQLSKKAKIIIFTARFGRLGKQSKNSAAGARDIAELTDTISQWLTTHDLDYDEIWNETGKPVASAYVDDRAVACRPEVDGLAAFEQASKAVDVLCNN